VEINRQKLIRKKLSHIAKRMKLEHIDAWLVFTREGNPDPIAKEFGLGTCTWRSAGVLTHDDRMYAIVGNLDTRTVSRCEMYDEVAGYASEGPVDLLSRLVKQKGLRRVAIDESNDFGLADGLSSGMKKYLRKHLQGIESYVPSEDLIIDLRGRLFPTEISKVRGAVRLTEEIFEGAQKKVIKEGVRDKEIFEYFQRTTKENGAGFSWDQKMNPSVCVGTIESQHSAYDNVALRRGKMLKIDFGINLDGYCSDLQRVYFCGSPPSKLKHDFSIARKANDASIKMLSPGAKGYQIDQAARQVLHRNGFRNFMHALGHTVGTTAHEIGPLLAPRWRNRYGRAMEKLIGKNIVFAIEPTVYSEFGGINLEQDVLVNKDGHTEELSAPLQEVISF